VKQKICQSCGMPLQKDACMHAEDFCTNASGSKNEEYCFHCFQNGKFLDEGITLEGKISKNMKFAVQMRAQLSCVKMTRLI